MKKHSLINNIFTSVQENVLHELNSTQVVTTHKSIPITKRILYYSLKDNMCVENDKATTCSSSILSNYKSPFNSTIYNLLSEVPNLKYLGKTRMDEFAMGSLGIGTVNPLFPGHVTGGSSSGSAASVSSGLVDFALGTDTGGSVRLPAAWCGTMGFKPSYGKISRYGVIDMAQSLDTVGIISDDLEVIQYVFQTLDHYDSLDLTSLPDTLRLKTGNGNVKKLEQKVWKIGLPKEICIDLVDSKVWNMFKQVLNRIIELENVDFYPVSIPSWKLCLPIYYTLTPSEVASNMSRYDGIRYGSRENDNLLKNTDVTLFSSTRTKHLGDEVKRRILLGNYTLSSGSFQNNYLKAQRLRMKLIKEFDSIFQLRNVLLDEEERNKNNVGNLDFILTPTSLIPPPKTADVAGTKATLRDHNPIKDYINDFFTVPMSLAGLPSITIPMVKKSPLGIQVVGQYGDDYNVLKFVKEVFIEQKVTGS